MLHNAIIRIIQRATDQLSVVQYGAAPLLLLHKLSDLLVVSVESILLGIWCASRRLPAA